MIHTCSLKFDPPFHIFELFTFGGKLNTVVWGIYTPTQLFSGLRSTSYVKIFRMSVQLSLISLSFFMISGFLLQHSLKRKNRRCVLPSGAPWHRYRYKAELPSSSWTTGDDRLFPEMKLHTSVTWTESQRSMEEVLRLSICHGVVLVS